MKFIDLHVHSNQSDGIMSPTDIVKAASNMGLAAVSITDHDTVSGIDEALTAGVLYNIQVVPGIEISTKLDDCNVHLLGYFFDHSNPDILKYVTIIRQVREERAKKIVSKLQGLGVKITYDLVKLKANGGVIGRPHIADVLIEEGYVYSFREAFDKYLGDYKTAYVPKPMVSPGEGIRIIHRAGGLAFVAHPVVELNDTILDKLVEMRLDGIEAFHPKHTPENVAHYLDYAAKRHLLVSGGSDCHGPRFYDMVMGSLKIPESYLKDIQKRLVQKPV